MSINIETIRETYIKEVGTDWIDPLSGLIGRGAFHFVLNVLAANIAGFGTGSWVFLFEIETSVPQDLNEFLWADISMRRAAETILNSKRPEDIAGRESQSSIAVFLPSVREKDASLILERWISAVSHVLEGVGSVHAGAAECHGTVSEDWIRIAARQLWETKHSPRDMMLMKQDSESQTSEKHFRVLVVDDDEKNRKLISMQLSTLGYEVLQAENGYRALNIAKTADIDLMLLDVMMPDLNGYEVCARMKSGEHTRQIPIVFLTVLDDKEARLKGIEVGGDFFLVKPPDQAELAACLLSLIRTRTKNRTFTSIENVLYSLATAVDAKDHYTRGHTDRVMNLATDLAFWLSYSKMEVDSLRIAGLLHDIGKIGIPVEILNKDGPLNESEWEEMKKHPDLGFQICLPLKHNLGEALSIIRHHHEKIDGSSYPDGLRGTALTRAIRLMTIVDMYDALCTDRPYRKALSREKTFEILFEDAENNRIDKDILVGLREMLAYRDFNERARRNEETQLYPSILLIENDPPNTKKVRRLLRQRKIRVFESPNAEDGIRIAYRHPPSLILIDMHLPGMDGLTGTKIMKSDPKLTDIPVVIMSYSESQKDLTAAKEAGCSGQVRKPIDEEEFAALIHDILSGKTTSYGISENEGRF